MSSDKTWQSITMDGITKKKIRSAAAHGGMSVAAFMRGATIKYMVEHDLVNLPVGRPPLKQELRRYDPAELPMTVKEFVHE